ncbi:hypothetical protein Tco_1424665 [Tanacetum coccineum]
MKESDHYDMWPSKETQKQWMMNPKSFIFHESEDEKKAFFNAQFKKVVAQYIVVVVVPLVEKESFGNMCGVDASEEAIILFPEHERWILKSSIGEWQDTITKEDGKLEQANKYYHVGICRYVTSF